jgi:hypothetical protein
MSAGAAWRTGSSKVSRARSISLCTASRSNAKRLLTAGFRVSGHLRNDEVSGLRPALKDEPTTIDHLCTQEVGAGALTALPYRVVGSPLYLKMYGPNAPAATSVIPLHSRWVR